VSKVVQTVQDMVVSLRDNGLPISAIAEIAKVERKTVYSWLDGTDVRETNAARVEPCLVCWTPLALTIVAYTGFGTVSSVMGPRSRSFYA
jgi:hypothetical protein